MDMVTFVEDAGLDKVDTVVDGATHECIYTVNESWQSLRAKLISDPAGDQVRRAAFRAA